MPTHYEALNIASGATPAEIKKAWRKVAFDCHPDRAGVRALPVAEEGKRANQFKRAMVAWDVLGDDAARSEYDREQVVEQRHEVRQERRRSRSARAQAYGNSAWQQAEAARRKLEQEFLRQEAARVRRNVRRKQAQAERRAKAKQRAADQRTDWESAHEAYLQGLVTGLRCEIAAFLLDEQ